MISKNLKCCSSEVIKEKSDNGKLNQVLIRRIKLRISQRKEIRQTQNKVREGKLDEEMLLEMIHISKK